MDLERIAQLTGNRHITVVTDEGQVIERNRPGEAWREVDSIEPETDTLRVLAFTPFHPGYGVRPQTWQSIQQAIQSYGGRVDWVAMHNDNPHVLPFDNVKRNQNRARLMALEGGYDALLSVEADMVIPPNTINGLIEADADIAYGLYVWRHKAQRWSAYTELGLFGGKSIAFHPEQARAAWGEIIDVVGLGMGCTLIRRDALEAIRFRLYEGGKDDWEVQRYGGQMGWMGADPYKRRAQMICTDWMLAMDATHYGYSQRCNLAVVCGHIDSDGGVLWPDPDAPELYRRETEDSRGAGEE